MVADDFRGRVETREAERKDLETAEEGWVVVVRGPVAPTPRWPWCGFGVTAEDFRGRVDMRGEERRGSEAEEGRVMEICGFMASTPGLTRCDFESAEDFREMVEVRGEKSRCLEVEKGRVIEEHEGGMMAGFREALEMKGEMGLEGQVEGGWEVHDSMAPTPESATAAE